MTNPNNPKSNPNLRVRNVAFLWALIGLVVIFYGLAIVRMSGGS